MLISVVAKAAYCLLLLAFRSDRFAVSSYHDRQSKLQRKTFELIVARIKNALNIHIRMVDARYFEPCIANTVYYIFEPFDAVTLTAVVAKLSSKLRGAG